jgi:hypothetical protein
MKRAPVVHASDAQSAASCMRGAGATVFSSVPRHLEMATAVLSAAPMDCGHFFAAPCQNGPPSRNESVGTITL